jgi:chemotaxis protein histidine kinase CheA
MEKENAIGRPDPKTLLEETRQALRVEYLRALPGKIESIAALVDKLGAEPENREEFDRFQSEVHSLAGTSALYGFAGLSAAARVLDLDLLERSRSGRPSPPPEAELRRTLLALRRALAALG